MEKFLFSAVIIFSLFLGSVSVITMSSNKPSLVDEMQWFFSEPELAKKLDRTRVKELVLFLEKTAVKNRNKDIAQQKPVLQAIIKGRELIRALHRYDVIQRNYGSTDPLLEKTASYLEKTKHDFLQCLHAIGADNTLKEQDHTVATGN